MAAAPIKKKGTLKQKLAEKEAAAKAAQENGDDSDEYDSDAVLDPREKARLDKERELKSDLNNAADLLGAAALGGLSSSPYTIQQTVNTISSFPQEHPPLSLTPSSPSNLVQRKTLPNSLTGSSNLLSNDTSRNLYTTPLSSIMLVPCPRL